jgi:hypothetical protein
MENINQINNLFFIKYTLWIILSFIAIFLSREKFFNLCIFLLFALIFFLQDDNTDLFYYKKSFFEGIYDADIGFIWLQLLLKNLPLNQEVSYNILKLSSLFLLFFIPKKKQKFNLYNICKSFFFLSHIQ